MDYSEAKKLVKARLSEKRWTHTKNVKKMLVLSYPHRYLEHQWYLHAG